MKVVVARGASAALLLSVGLATFGSVAGTAGALAGRVETDAVCRDTLGDTGPHLRPATDVAPGQVASVGVTWRKEAWSGDRLAEIVTCASVDGRLAPELTTWEANPPNDGETTISLTMPEDLVGSVVCRQPLLVGMANGVPSISKATPFCFRIVPQAGTPAPAAAPSVAQPPVAPPAAPANDAAPAPAPKEEAAAPPAAPSPAGPTVLGEALTRPPDQAAAPGSAAVPPSASGLPRTGSAERLWTAAAGGLLALGGLAVALGAPTARSRAALRRR